jgi:outer membrane immunogenic protein
MRGVRCATLAAVAVFGFASVASAADLPKKASVYKAPAAAPIYNWTGCHVGLHIGGGWGTAKWTDPAPDPGQLTTDEGTDSLSGMLGGGQIGCDYQTGTWVFGIEADASWASLSGEHPNPIFVPDVLHTKVDGLGTVSGRLGYAIDKALIYAKGGAAWSHNKYPVSAPNTGTFATATESRWGWTVGAGLEYGLTPNWSVKLEYDFLDFGTERVRLDCPTCSAGFFEKDIDQNIHAVKLGANYKFY